MSDAKVEIEEAEEIMQDDLSQALEAAAAALTAAGAQTAVITVRDPETGKGRLLAIGHHFDCLVLLTDAHRTSSSGVEESLGARISFGR